ncbi:MAG: hypothetical protein L0322_19625, partial [Chloroflexi bacterium]|nr:hypothetical protein [Chloroflexota bacterium]
MAVESESVEARVVLAVTRPQSERALVPAAGGQIQIADGRVHLNFPPEWQEKGSEFSFQVLEQHPLSGEENGVILAFALEANTRTTEVAAFNSVVNVRVQLGDLVDLEKVPAERLALYAREAGGGDWAELPVTVDMATGTVEFSATRSSEFQILSEPEPWEFTYNPPGASGFTGAANYSYAFSVPPGAGGLAPSLSLSYGSRGVDSMKDPVMSTGFGAGWSMPQAEISNGNATEMYLANGGNGHNFDNRLFTLVLNGVTHHLEPLALDPEGRHGRYIANGDPSLYIEYKDNAPGNVTGEYWIVRASDGTTYTFGLTEDAEQVVAPISAFHNSTQPRNDGFAAASWKLDSITNLYSQESGRQVDYVYRSKCVEDFDNNPGGCLRYSTPDLHVAESDDPAWNPQTPAQSYGKFRSEVDVAVHLIRYNFVNSVAQTEISFGYYGKNWGLVRLEGAFMTVGHLRPWDIVIKQASNVVAAYTFVYGENEHYLPPGVADTQFWWLMEVRHYGSDYGQPEALPLPVQSFFYEEFTNHSSCGWDGPSGNPPPNWVCVPLLIRVNNGYGANTKLVYGRLDNNGNPHPDGDWFHVTDIYTWDGTKYIYDGNNASAGSHILYNRTGYTACYDTGENLGVGCRSPRSEASDALAGFNGVQVEVQKPNGSGGWTTLSYQRQTFYVDPYWLNGKTITQLNYDPTGASLLSGHLENWTWDGTARFAILNHETNLSYNPSDSNINLGTHTTYTYDVTAQEGRQWGKPTHTNTYEFVNGVQAGTYFRQQITGYQSDFSAETGGTGWLIVPYQRSIHDATTTVRRATLYLYDNNTDPDDQTLTLGQLAWQLEVVVPDGAPQGTWNAIATRSHYFTTAGAKFGLLQKTTQYSSYATIPISSEWGSATLPAAGNWRSQVEVEYNSNGLTLAWQRTQGNGVPQLQTTTYNDYHNTFAWLPTSVTAPNGADTLYDYDRFGRLTAVWREGDTDPNNPTIKYIYWDDPNGVAQFVSPLLIEVAYKDQVQENTRRFYDGLGRLIQEQQEKSEIAGLGQQDVLVTYEYDARGLTTCQTTPYNVTPYNWNGSSPYRNDNCASLAHTTTHYDALGRVTETIAPDLAETNYDYAITTHVTVNGSSVLQRTRIYDPLNQVTNYFNDSFGRLVKVRENTGTTPPYTAYSDTEYTYDLFDNLLWVKTKEPEDDGSGDILRQSEIGYDNFGRKTYMDDPDMGVWTYSYDIAGNLSRQKDANGQQLCFYYDALNRITAKAQDSTPGNACPATAPTGIDRLATYTYDTAPNGIGQLASVSWGNNPAQNYETFSYDVRGRLSNQTRFIDGRPYPQAILSYDTLDRPLQAQYPGGETVTTAYNNQGLPESLVGASSYVPSTPTPGATYNVQGQLASLTRGNNQVTTYGYDPLNFRLTSLTTSNNLQNLSYTYDPAGNIESIINDLAGDAEDDVQEFTYDSLNRLQTAEGVNPMYGCTTFVHCYNHTYSYDPLGNITSRIESATSLNYGYSAGHPQAVTDIHGSGGSSKVIEIMVKALNASGDTMLLRVNGVTVKSWSVTSTSYQLKSWTTPLSGSDIIEVVSLNGRLQVDYITVDGVTIQAEGEAIVFDQGSGNAAYDGQNVVAGQEVLNVPGALRHVTNQAQSFGYNANGNMIYRHDLGAAYRQTFDVENRLAAIEEIASGEITRFYYDANGQRTITEKPDGTVIYYPFPAYEEEVQPELWANVPINSPGPATSDNPGWTMTTADSPGWSFSTPSNLSWTGSQTFPGTATIASGEYTLSNLANGSTTSQLIPIQGGYTYVLSAWVKGELNPNASTGSARIEILRSGGFMPTAPETIWYSNNLNSNTWQQVQGIFQMEAGSNQSIQIRLTVDGTNGWVAFDDLTLADLFSGGNVTIPDGDFEFGNWTSAPHASFPATSIWRGNSGPAVPAHRGSYSMVLSNLGHTELTSPFINLNGSSQTLQVWLRGEVDGANSAGQLIVTMDYYNSANGYIRSALMPWTATTYNNLTWQQITVSDNAPIGAVKVKVRIGNTFNNGWMAFDDVTLSGISTPVPDSGFETGGIWTITNHASFPAGAAWRGALTGHSGQYAYTLTNGGYGNLTSGYITISPNRLYSLSALVRGEHNALAGYNMGKILVQYYDSQNNPQGSATIWNGNDVNNNNWTLYSQSFTPGSNVSKITIVLQSAQANGWLAFDDLTLTSHSAAVSSGPGQEYDLSAWVQGVTSPPGGGLGGRILVNFYNGSGGSLGSEEIWVEDYYNQPAGNGQLQSGSFTTPANAASFRVALETHLDDGWLAFHDPTLTGWS